VGYRERVAPAHSFFDEHGMQDPCHWAFDHSKHEHFALYCGVVIVSYADIQLCIMEAIVRIVVVTKGNRSQGFGSPFLEIIEEWLKLHVQSSGRPIGFYQKHGYTKMPVDGPYLNPYDIPLGKVLA
jgi:GNAT superfamily N-acetyltransferase